MRKNDLKRAVVSLTATRGETHVCLMEVLHSGTLFRSCGNMSEATIFRLRF